jgi:hypothetical protein
MRNQLSALLLSAAMASGVHVFTQSRPQAGNRDATVSSDEAQAAASSTTTLRVSGTIAQYDTGTRTLSVTTTNGTVQFPVVASVRITRSGQRIDASELKKLTGYHAAVRYSEAHGARTVESVTVFEKSERTPR